MLCCCGGVSGLTPLMRAVALGKLEVIQALLEAGADPWVGGGGLGRRLQWAGICIRVLVQHLLPCMCV
jgi:hypothetical protein